MKTQDEAACIKLKEETLKVEKFADQAETKVKGLESELKRKIWEMASNK